MSASFRRSVRNRSHYPASKTSRELAIDKDPIPSDLSGRLTSSNEDIPSRQLSVSRPVSSALTTLERKGTRPWVGGLTLTSSGLRELDAILGGGQPLGTVMLVEEDRWTQDLALALTRCWCAEAVSQGQILSLVATQPTLDMIDLSSLDIDTHAKIGSQQHGMTPDDLHAFLSLLPKDLHLEKRNRSDTMTPSADPSKKVVPEVRQAFLALTEEDDNEDFDEGAEIDQDDANANSQEKMDRSDAGLTNAWQYKQSVQQDRMGQTSLNSQKKRVEREDKVFCHSYDLSGKMQDQYAQHLSNHHLIHITDCSCTLCPRMSCQKSRACAIALYEHCLTHIESQLQLHPSQVVRLLIPNAPVPTLALTLPLLLTAVRSRAIPVVLLITIRPWTLLPKHLHYLTSLRRTSDAVFLCKGFAGTTSPPPPEFSDLAGILSIKKLAIHSNDSITKTRPPSNRYGMKRDRRKLHVRMLHLPPEDFSKGGSSVGGGGARSGGGRTDVNSSAKKTVLEPGMSCGRNTGANGRKSGLSLEF